MTSGCIWKNLISQGTGKLFKKCRAYAQNSATPYYILSALHGFLRPDDIIRPYNFTLKRLTHRERQAWGSRVVDSIVWNVPASSTVTLLAGNYYAESIECALTQKGFTIHCPLKGFAIGKQQQRLVALLTAYHED
jgi:cytoplasmic iron level regulating protein YaaA (DUF328/UPF0246 family)